MIQNYRNHRRYVLLYHVLTLAAILALLIGSFVNLAHSSRDNLYSASLLVLIAFILALLYAFVRRFPLKVQDRVIRLEEKLRYHRLLNTDLAQRTQLLTAGQTIALRFAADEELSELVQEVLAGKLGKPDDVKRAIEKWRADELRV